ncbi:hypothetical protein FEF26_00535 [Nesterenkonia salmonea]|uniref:Uncharacterized protein n=1 Tax=Nesterenkonia salmonea TaxID=1804987 RepID=A0A5R9BLJ5_9MICC|nr:hypothetical protein [Nesterenkonia salmonea]TLQ01497.1 hypothetical protein FEF26_00535 [Nesterenkonia salmonea]
MTSSLDPEDLRLIDAFEPAMRSLLPAQDEPVHAEVLLALCLGDGLLEVLEWSREGTGADPAASMWLAALRWHKVVTGGFPVGAPQPRPRPTDHALRLIVESAGLELIPGSADTSLASLATAEMGTRGAPPQPEVDDDAALLRILPISLVPYVEDSMKQSWAEQAICLTHGNRRLLRESRRRAVEVPDPAQHGASHELLNVVVEDLSKRWRKTTLPGS